MAPEPAEYIANILIDLFDDITDEKRNNIFKIIKYLTECLHEDYNIELVIYNLFDKAVKNKNMQIVEYIIDECDEYVELYDLINIIIGNDNVECFKMIFDSYDFSYKYIDTFVDIKYTSTGHNTLKYILSLGYSTDLLIDNDKSLKIYL